MPTSFDIDSELDSLHALSKMVSRYGYSRLGKDLDAIETSFVESGEREDMTIETAEYKVVVPGGLLELYSMLEEHLHTSEEVLMMSIDINPRTRGLLATMYDHSYKSYRFWDEILSAYHCADVCAKRRLSTKITYSCDLFNCGWWTSVLGDYAHFTDDMIDFLRRRAPMIERRITKRTVEEVLASRVDDELWERSASFDLDVPIYMIPILVEDGTLESLTSMQLSASLAWFRLGESIIRYIYSSE